MSNHKSYQTTVIGLRLPNRLVAALRALAASEGVELSVYIREVLTA